MLTDQDIEKLKTVFATKEDLKSFATKEDIKGLSMEVVGIKNELNSFATKDYIDKAVDEIIKFISPAFSRIDDHEARLKSLEKELLSA